MGKDRFASLWPLANIMTLIDRSSMFKFCIELLTPSITPLCVDPSNPSFFTKLIVGKNIMLRTVFASNAILLTIHPGCSLNAQYSCMKPFQRKWALVATAVELLKSLDFLNDYQRQEIMFRTGTSKEQLPPVLAW
jgi:hypothetical protein